jgi:dipeptidyl aminopeptidase/acylaminoacyl peptidase
LPAEGGELDVFPSSFTAISDVHVKAETQEVVFLGSSPSEPQQVIAMDLESANIYEVRQSMDFAVSESELSEPEPISWDAPDGDRAHGFFYPPVSDRVATPDDEKPPLIVKSHGGPTSMSTSDFDLSIQFWTSRGFGVLDVNYGGSTGYGRAYRQRLIGSWGIVDVQDCIAGALFLAEDGKVDGARMVIKGGSAGGYTTLAALTFHDVFLSGVSSYGVGDLEALATDTHKFESRYLDSLVGAYPEEKHLYDQRSPIHHVDRLRSAMLLLQGMDDKVVPSSQAIKMAEAVRENGLPVALLLFEGEGHGFRREETLHRVLEAELSFHSQIFGFPHPEDIPKLEIENLLEAQ